MNAVIGKANDAGLQVPLAIPDIGTKRQKNAHHQSMKQRSTI